MHDEEKQFARQQIADFRYSVVAELCNPYLTEAKRKQLIQEKSSRQYSIPGSSRTSISVETIRNWMTCYKQYGREGLLPKLREDRGRPRAFSDAEAAAIIAKLEAHPEWTARTAIRELEKNGEIRNNISSSALSRFLKANNMRREERLFQQQDKDQRRFAFEAPLECVQSDAMHAFPVPYAKGKKRKAILLAFLDDHTRRILYARFLFNEKAIHFEDGVRHILKAYGRIGRLYTDNGATFVSKQTKRILDTLGVYLIHSRPYKPQGRGKIERFFRTVRQSFLRPLDKESIKSLEQLNHLFATWLENEYHRMPHSALGCTPLEAWLANTVSIKHMDPHIDIDETFYHVEYRKVHKDSIISVNGTAFEAPSVLIGQKVQVRFDPHKPKKIVVLHNGKDYGEARPVDAYANSKIKRSDFSGKLEVLPESGNTNNNNENETKISTPGGLL